MYEIDAERCVGKSTPQFITPGIGGRCGIFGPEMSQPEEEGDGSQAVKNHYRLEYRYRITHRLFVIENLDKEVNPECADATEKTDDRQPPKSLQKGEYLAQIQRGQCTEDEVELVDKDDTVLILRDELPERRMGTFATLQRMVIQIEQDQLKHETNGQS